VLRARYLWLTWSLCIYTLAFNELCCTRHWRHARHQSATLLYGYAPVAHPFLYSSSVHWVETEVIPCPHVGAFVAIFMAMLTMRSNHKDGLVTWSDVA
jgi:hypothetical protein